MFPTITFSDLVSVFMFGAIAGALTTGGLVLWMATRKWKRRKKPG